MLTLIAISDTDFLWIMSEGIIPLYKGSSNMEGTLLTDFTKSEIMRDNKMLCKGLLNNLKKDIDFQNKKGVALKLSPPRPFKFWNKSGH